MDEVKSQKDQAETLAHEAYQKRFDESYKETYEMLHEVAHKVGQKIYEAFVGQPYKKNMDVNASKARSIAENIAKEMSVSVAEEEGLDAYAEVYDAQDV